MLFRLLCLTLLVLSRSGFSQCPTETALTFYQQEDLDSFLIKYPDCTEYTGTIGIDICTKLVDNDQFVEFSIYDLSPLKKLKSLGGIWISKNPNCSDYNKPPVNYLSTLYGLHNLTELGSFSMSYGIIPILTLEELSQIKELEYLEITHSELTTISDNRFDILITKGLKLVANKYLKDISGLKVSEDIESIEITWNQSLSDAQSLADLISVGHLELSHLDNIDFLSSVRSIGNLELDIDTLNPEVFENLEEIGDIKLRSIENLKDLSILSNANFVGEKLEIVSCSFTSLYGLDIASNTNLDIIKLNNLPLENLGPVSNASSVTELEFRDLPALDNMPNLENLSNLINLSTIGLNKLESLKSIKLRDSLRRINLSNLSLSTLEGLETLTACDFINISNLNDLESLAGLENLNSLGSLSISGNERLENFDDLLNLQKFKHSSYNQYLYIQDNAMLSSIEGISNWRASWKNIQLSNNPKLSECSIPPLCDSYGANTRITIADNKVGCNSDDEIKSGCGYKFFQVFLDENENGRKEDTELGLPLGHLESDKRLSFYPGLDGFGDYNSDVELDNFEYLLPENYTLTTSNAYIDLTLAIPDTIFFGLSPAISVTDYDAYLTYNPVICDRNYSAFLHLQNKGTELLSGPVLLDLPGNLRYGQGAIVEQDSNQIVVNVDNVIPGQIFEVQLFMQGPSISDQSIDSLLNYRVEAQLSSIMDDTLFVNKHYTSEFLCAYDPNDKQVFPEGVDQEQYTLMDHSSFQYTIRFQNTGNFPATDVIIRDTLDANLDPSTLKIIGTSHSRLNTIRHGSAIEFRYKNIFLPDSVHNESESHGFVSYTIERYPDLEPFTQIKNRAHIYFDSNPAIVTNTTSNLMVEYFPSSIKNIESIPMQINVWPTPVSRILNVKLGENFSSDWEFYNISGNLLETGKINSSVFQIDVGAYPAGIYLIKVGEVAQKIIKD